MINQPRRGSARITQVVRQRLLGRADRTSFYRDQQAWRDLQQFLPQRLRLGEGATPDEEFWRWRGHRVHLDTYRNPDAPAKVVLHHGVGTNGRQMSMILGAPLAASGFEVIALDNLGYGLTAVASRTTPTYDMWVELVRDYLEHEHVRDGRPIVLFGLSAGGMLAYHVAASAPAGTLSGIVGMTFLDQREQLVRDATAHDRITARIGLPVVKATTQSAIGRLRYPMTWAAKMSTLVNDERALRVMTNDATSAGSAMHLRFLASYMSYLPAVEPQDFAACPILLTQPERDRWTPQYLSDIVLDRVRRVPVSKVVLENAAHYPLEEPGLLQLHDAVAGFVRQHAI
jgi:pimeloyl-ACP methyl ester carboxylesterase